MNTTIEEVAVKPKRKMRVKDKDQVPVPSGPTSLNPGTWLTNEYENLQGADLSRQAVGRRKRKIEDQLRRVVHR